MSCVYKHTAPDGRVYIGITTWEENPNIRWSGGKGYKDNPEFWKCICEVGWDNIEHEIVASDLYGSEARKLEKELIDKYDSMIPNGFNRRRDSDNPGDYRRTRKREVGNRYGGSTVYDYWPDSDGYKVYRLQCDCGKFFVCHGWDMKPDMVCEECEKKRCV